MKNYIDLLFEFKNIKEKRTRYLSEAFYSFMFFFFYLYYYFINYTVYFPSLLL